MNKVNKNDCLIPAGDLNARIGSNATDHVTGKFGEQALNKNGLKLIDFATYRKTRIMNTFYKHKDIHKYTWSARNHRPLIDYFLANEKTAKMFLDVRAFRGLEIDSDHYLVQAELRFPQRWYNSIQFNSLF
jgi:endonuclease/exonuclease/phosphatase family metal-dependent hydrolase